MRKIFFGHSKTSRALMTLLVLFLTACQASQEDLKNLSVQPDDSELALQVPLDQTAQERVAFAEELKQQTSYNLRPLYEKWIDVIGANGIIDTIQTLEPTCHDIEHDLGKVIYDKTEDVGNALKTCDESCNSGCMHGVLMEFFSKKGLDLTQADHVDLDDLKGEIATICGDENTAGDPTMGSIYKVGDCAHGVGHALMFLSNYQIPKATEYCSLFDTDVLDYYCATGAYMEYVNVNDQKDTLEHPENPFYPCDSVEYPAACFRYKMAHVVPRWYQAGKPLSSLELACLALDENAELGCFHGIGNGNNAYVSVGMVKLNRICAAGTKDDQYVCTEGLMERLARYKPDLAAEQCETVDGWQQDLCEESLKNELYDLDKPFDLYLR